MRGHMNVKFISDIYLNTTVIIQIWEIFEASEITKNCET